jgi:hypothetical protein
VVETAGEAEARNYLDEASALRRIGSPIRELAKHAIEPFVLSAQAKSPHPSPALI